MTKVAKWKGPIPPSTRSDARLAQFLKTLPDDIEKWEFRLRHDGHKYSAKYLELEHTMLEELKDYLHECRLEVRRRKEAQSLQRT